MNIEIFWALKVIVNQKDKNQKNKNNRIDNQAIQEIASSINVKMSYV